ncbi:MAG: hypothetical protein NC313_01400 [Butyrivibrio sp.]|nr:hypothetical protein [Butyrivibrio sp.]
MKQPKKDIPILSIYILGFIILAMSLAISQPLADTPPLYANPPDEYARYLIPQYICRYGTLPTGLEAEVRIPGYGTSYALYNIFPYIIQGYLMRFVNLFTDSEIALLYTARIVDVCFGAFMAFMVYLISIQLFKDRRFRWLFCFAVMYLPQNLFIHSYVNTDSCCLLAVSMMIYALIKSYKEGFKTSNCLWLCAGIILCALSYYNAYGYILSCIMLFIAYFIKADNGRLSYDWKQMLKKGIFISIIVLLGISWWFIHKYIVLDGDFLGFATNNKLAELYAVDKVNPLTSQTYQKMGYTVLQMMKERNMVEMAFRSFVAAYGSMAIYSSDWLYFAYKILFITGIIGVIYWGLNRKFFYKSRRALSGKEIFFHINMLFCIIMPIILLIYYAYTMDYQNQGRYVLPSLIPLMFYIIKGLEKLSALRLKEYTLPRPLINVCLSLCFILIIGGTVEMVLFRTVPICIRAGMVLI